MIKYFHRSLFMLRVSLHQENGNGTVTSWRNVFHRQQLNNFSSNSSDDDDVTHAHVKTRSRRRLEKCENLDKLVINTEKENRSIPSKYMLKHNVDKQSVFENPWLLQFDTETLSKRLKTVSDILMLESDELAVSFMEHSVNKLYVIGYLWKTEVKHEHELKHFKHRLEYLAFELKCTQIEVADAMARVHSLMTMPFKKIKLVLKTLLDAGVTTEAIISDPWIFMHNVNLMKKRIKLSKENGLKDIKPWSLRCSSEKFEIHVSRAVKENELRGGKIDIDNFLKDRLNSTSSQVSAILQKVPLLKQTSAIKLDRMITFLFSKGISSQDILACPRILRFKVETVAEKLARLSQLTNEKGKRYPISVLTQSSRNFEKFTDCLISKSEENLQKI